MFTESFPDKHVHPTEVMEPEQFREPTEEELRILCKDYMRLLLIIFEDALHFIEDSKNPEMALAGVVFALGLTNFYGGKPMGEVSLEKGYARGICSRYANDAAKALKVPIPFVMQQEHEKRVKKKKIQCDVE
jgi:hypothetical protein